MKTSESPGQVVELKRPQTECWKHSPGPYPQIV